MGLTEVIELAERNDKTVQRVRSARQWLNKAEESLDQEHELQAELSLLLAQAELQHVQETRGQHWLKKYPAVWHGLAAGIAVVAVGLVYGLYSARPVQPVPTVKFTQPVLQLAPLSTEQLTPPPRAMITIETEHSQPPVQPVSTQPAAVEKAAAPVSPAELKSLIRDAGRTLRGE